MLLNLDILNHLQEGFTYFGALTVQRHPSPDIHNLHWVPKVGYVTAPTLHVPGKQVFPRLFSRTVTSPAL